MTLSAGQAQAAAELARFLGELRSRAGLSLRDLEAKGGWDHSTFSRAEKEDWPVPTEPVLHAFLVVCERALAERSTIDDTDDPWDDDPSPSEVAWRLWRVATNGTAG